ncbi:hypothetical protein [Arthrobacter sp. NPDC058127]|uniref:hypothetical protein n=1 Tax=Arthrobacter sp. NPDC058127 TaxID=3346351 RepID=UPI0036EA0632
MATEEDARVICRGLPGVSERPSWGQPAWFGKTLMARMWVRLARIDVEELDELLQESYRLAGGGAPGGEKPGGGATG